MKQWSIIPILRRKRPTVERQQIPLAPPPEYYPPGYSYGDTFRGEEGVDPKESVDAPPRGVIITDM